MCSNLKQSIQIQNLLDKKDDWNPSNNICPGTYTITAKDANNCSITTSVTIINPPGFTFNIPTITQPTCPNPCSGSIVGAGYTGGGSGPNALKRVYFRPATSPISTVTTVGTGPVNYTGLCAGTYWIIGENLALGCKDSISVTLALPPIPDITHSFYQSKK